MKRYFLITSSGAAATRWLGSCLNRHPAICCSCGAGELAETIEYGRPNSAEHAEKIANYLLSHCMGASAELRPVDAIFDELEAYREAEFYGNVHGETLLTFHANQQKHALSREVKVVNLVRHPIPRTESKFAMIQKECAASPTMRKVCQFQLRDRLQRMASIADAIEGQIGEIENDENRGYFVSALLDTIGVASELTFAGIHPPVRHYRIEDLKNQPECFAELIRDVTFGRLSPDEAYLNQVFAPENLNAERYRTDGQEKRLPRDAESQWHAWEPWQRDAFQAAMGASEFHQPFEQIGYLFSFIGAPNAPLHPGYRKRSAPPTPKVLAPALFNQMP